MPKPRSPRLSLLLLVALVPACLPFRATGGDFDGNPEVARFIDRVAQRHHMRRTRLAALLHHAHRLDKVLAAIARPAEKKPWYQYRRIFLTRDRIQGGAAFWDRYQDLLARAADRYGVDPAVVVAIIGVETRYGRHAGRFHVLDALATLAFDYPPRQRFFRSELEEFLVLAEEEKIDPLAVRGSYAGAMGGGQFMPSSYRRFAVDFDGDGRRDLWRSTADVIGSVAHYLGEHGWRRGGPIALPARVGGADLAGLLDKGLQPTIPVAELARRGIRIDGPAPAGARVTLVALQQRRGKAYWVGFQNFYVITRYNHSPLYAMAVYQLSRAIARHRAAQLAHR